MNQEKQHEIWMIIDSYGKKRYYSTERTFKCGWTVQTKYFKYLVDFSIKQKRDTFWPKPIEAFYANENTPIRKIKEYNFNMAISEK